MIEFLLLAPLALQGAPQPAFTDVSTSSGALFFDQGGAFGMQMGGGVAWFDLEGDGDDDLFLAASGGQNRLLRNDGGAFADATAGAGIETTGSFDPFGAVAADHDQDGRTDLYVLTTAENVLLRNVDGASFADATTATGLGGGPAWTSSAAWADFDVDGDLDLYVGNYIRTVSFPYHEGEPNLLFENTGARGGGGAAFLDRGAELGVDCIGVFGPSDPQFPQYVSPEGEPAVGTTLAVATYDFDDDGLPDIQVGNDFGMWVLPNALYRNTSAGGALSFDNVAASTGFDQRPQYNMGITAADLDHDGDWDFYLSNLGPNVLLRNDGGTFVDATRELGAAEGTNPDGSLLYSTWGTVWQDLDNDTWEDLFVVNGFVPAAPFIDNDLREANAVWRNRRGLEFRRLGDAASGLADEGPGRGASWTDFDGDGRVDLHSTNNLQVAVTFPEDGTRLWGNRVQTSNHWLELRLRGTSSNLEGIGARIEARVGGQVLRRQVLAHTVYVASSSPLVHLGLGRNDTVEELTVRWPSGVVQVLSDVAGDRLLEIVEPAASTR